jgi:hypothetical protein
VADSTASGNNRYEIRDYAIKSSRRKFHIWDRETESEVFHTDSRERAEELVRIAGAETITQHHKDYGHARTPDDGRFPCKRCRPSRKIWYKHAFGCEPTGCVPSCTFAKTK